MAVLHSPGTLGSKVSKIGRDKVIPGSHGIAGRKCKKVLY